jgi:hypothetical protein
MKAVRNRSQARWLPSRYRFAIFRLYALVRLALSMQDTREADIALQIDRDQSNEEQYAVALLVLGTATSYLAVLLPVVTMVAIAIAIPLAGLAVQVPTFIVGSLLPDGRDNASINGIVLMSILTAASVYFMRSASWAHIVAWFFLGALAFNGTAWCVAFLLRRHITAMDREYGGPAFET